MDLDEKGLEYQRVEEIASASAEERLKDSPTLQVPAYSDGDLKRWDSAVIIDHLMTTYPNATSPRSHQPFANSMLRDGHELDDKLLSATLNTLGESVSIVTQLKFTGITAEENRFAARNAVRTQHILDWAEPRIYSDRDGFFPGVMSVQDMQLACWLMFIDKRPINVEWRSADRPKITALHDRLAARPSFANNPIWWFDVGVTGYEPDGTPIYGEVV